MSQQQTGRRRTLNVESLERRQCMAANISNVDIYPGAFSSSPSVVELNGQFYMAADNGTVGRELFRLNADNSLTLVADLAPGPASSNVSNLTSKNGLLYFTVDSPENGFRVKTLCRSDGTPAGTFGLIGQVYEVTTGMVQMGNQLYFGMNRLGYGDELFKTDGTAAGTVLVKDIDPYVEEHPYTTPYFASSSPRDLTVFNGQLYFAATDSPQRELYRTDGTAAGTAKVFDLTGRGNSNINAVTAFNGSLYFTVTINNGPRWYRSNGTLAGTKLLASGFKSLSQTTEYNGALYFVATNFANGQELWKQPTSGAPFLVKDINPSGSSNPSQLTNANGKLYFTADDGVHGVELWQSNGTAAGTVLVRDVNPGQGSSDPVILGNLNGTLYFAATDQGATGRELWQTNSVVSSARLAQDLNPGSGNSDPSQMAINNNEAVFAARRNAIGFELWRLTPALPIMTLPAVAPQSYTGVNPVRLAPQATLTDADTSVFLGGKLSVTLGTSYQPGDRITLIPTANVTIDGARILVRGVVVGVKTTANNGRDLAVLFVQGATISRVREVIRAIAYTATTSSPLAGSRLVRFDLTDGEGGVASTQTVGINVA